MVPLTTILPPTQPHGPILISLHEWLHGDAKRYSSHLQQGVHDPSNGITTTSNDHVDSKQTQQPKTQPLPLVDLRSADEFYRRRISPSKTATNKCPVTVVNLPFDTLVSGERSGELPPRNVEFAILIPARQHDASDDQLEDKRRREYEEIVAFFGATISKATQMSRTPWSVRQIVLESSSELHSGSDVWQDAAELNVLTENGEHLMYPSPRLWQPDALVRNDLLPLMHHALEEYDHDSVSATPLQVWDLGSGAGRDLCFLAEELKSWWVRRLTTAQQENNNKTIGLFQTRGVTKKRPRSLNENDTILATHDYPIEQLDKQHPQLEQLQPKITNKNQNNDESTGNKNDVKPKNRQPLPPIQFVGYDNHKGSASKSKPFFRHRGVDGMVSTCRVNLNQVYVFHVLLQQQSTTPTLIYAVRYLNRRILNYVVHGTMPGTHNQKHKKQTNHDQGTQTPSNLSFDCPMSYGTYFAMSHFCKESESATWNYDHPKVKQVLERNELRNLFTATATTNNPHTQQATSQWKVLKDEIRYEFEDTTNKGRPLIQFVAQFLGNEGT